MREMKTRKIILVFGSLGLTALLLGAGGVKWPFLTRTANITAGSIADGFARSDLNPPRLKVEDANRSSITLVWDFMERELVPGEGLGAYVDGEGSHSRITGFRIYRDGFWLTDLSREQTSVVDDGLFPGESYRKARGRCRWSPAGEPGSRPRASS